MKYRDTLHGVLLLSLIGLAAFSPSSADDPFRSGKPVVTVPRVEQPPVLEDFLDMKVPARFAGRLGRVEGFIQRTPEDGSPSSQRTEVYLAYDAHNLYAIFIAHDDEPEKMRAHVSRREDVFGDEIVEIQLDTFNDERRAYSFVANPHGVQWDAIWTEGSGFDDSWDTVWHTTGRLTDGGYVVLMSIPFKSLRFPATAEQTWGFVLVRDIPRNDEGSFWPHVSERIEGRLNQGALLTGLSGISPGRNIQLIPYGTSRSFRVLDPAAPELRRDDFDPDAGLDAKLVLKDSLALDLTVNPDFSQVESDQPQVTVNQRFEVFFPEKRPFFLENAGYFQTPVNLLFTRRIADPSVGARLTGKLGKYSLGALLIDDEAPGKSVPVDDPLRGERARFGVLRLSRDLLKQSNVGLLFTNRELDDGSNDVGGIDGRFKIGENWDTRFQAVYSSNRPAGGGPESSDQAYDLSFNRNGRHHGAHIHYREFGPEFRTDAGFVNRTDLKDLHWSQGYRFRPEGPKLISWRPDLFVQRLWDFNGTRLEYSVNVEIDWEFRRQTGFELAYHTGRERLRVSDFSTLLANRDFSTDNISAFFRTHFIDAVDVSAFLSVGKGINFVSPSGQPPQPADRLRGNLDLTLRPMSRLRISNTYLFTRLDDRRSDGRVFTNQILRTRWSWQFNAKLSLRAILQYDETDANSLLTRLEPTQSINGDLLLTYLINPWTAVYLGYNSNYRNLELIDGKGGRQQLVRTEDDFLNDARQLFVKVSYLFRL